MFPRPAGPDKAETTACNKRAAAIAAPLAIPAEGEGAAAQTWAGLSLDRPRIMGVLNVTPDSFSDGGRYVDPDRAIEAGLRMVKDGADIVDVGGESTRPGASAISPEEEQRRVTPVVRALAAAGAIVSIDTRNAVTMETALRAGAAIVNDISALTHDRRSASIVAGRACPVVLMHMRGTPATMNDHAAYVDVVREVAAELAARIARARRAGIAEEAIAIDPGIGFAKLAPDSTALLRGLPALAALGRPIVLGVSRKSFIGRLGGESDPARRMPGSLAAGLFAIMQGACILRVHDVAETVQAGRVWAALTSPNVSFPPPGPAR